MRLKTFCSTKHVLTKAAELIENELTIKAPWGRIAVATWGEPGSKPVLLCHGKIDSAAVFRPLVNLLPRNFFYIGVDFPGNGRSDHLPRGVPISVLDFVPTVELLVDHFKLDKFTYIGHSMGSHVGKYYHIAHPTRTEAAIDIDPVPAYVSYNINELDQWYEYFYGRYFNPDNYSKYNATPDTAPTYTYDKALRLMKENRGLTEEAAKIALERTLEPAGEGLFRFTFDQRMKTVVRPPFSSKYLQDLYTKMSMPILCILAEESLAQGWFDKTPFILDETAYKNGNYRVVRVPGNHDVHLCHPERIAGEISKFLRGNLGVISKL